MIFTRAQAISALRKLYDSNAKEFEIEWVIDARPNIKARRDARHEHDLYAPNSEVLTPDEFDDHVPTISAADCRAIAALRYPDLDFSEENVRSLWLQI